MAVEEGKAKVQSKGGRSFPVWVGLDQALSSLGSVISIPHLLPSPWSLLYTSCTVPSGTGKGELGQFIVPPLH